MNLPCSSCGQEKIEDEFHLDRRNPRGRQYACKKCRSQNSRQAKLAVLRVANWRQNNSIKGMLNRARARARAAGVAYDLRPEDVIIPEFCPVLGMRLVRGRGRLRPESPSLDRMIPSLGYVRGNIAIMSLKANLMKSDATPLQLLRFATWVGNTYA